MKSSLIFTMAMMGFKNSLRNRWVLSAALLFGLLALSLSYFGFAGRGETGFSSYEATIVSLTSLVTYLAPLIALILGFDSIVGEAEGKTLELLLTLPLSRGELFMGKFLGLAMALALAMGSGFGLAGLIIGWMTGPEKVGLFLAFIGSSYLLGLAFLSLAMMVSAVAKESSKAIGTVLFLWFFFVLLFDLLLIGILTGSEGNFPPKLFSLLLYANPTDIFRLINLFAVEELKTAYGLATLSQGEEFSLIWLCTGLTAWIILPLLAGYRFFLKMSHQ